MISSWGVQLPTQQHCNYPDTSLYKLNENFAAVNKLAPQIKSSLNVLGYAERNSDKFYGANGKLDCQNLEEKVMVSVDSSNPTELRVTRIYRHKHPNMTRFKQLGSDLPIHVHQEATVLRFQKALIDDQIELIRSILQHRGDAVLFQLVEKRGQIPAKPLIDLLKLYHLELPLLYSQYTAINAFPQSSDKLPSILEGVEFSYGDKFQLTGTKQIAISKEGSGNPLLNITGSLNLNPSNSSKEFSGKYHLPTGELSNFSQDTKNLCYLAYVSIQKSVTALEQHFKAIK